MADMVTVQELENAKIDARTIGESVNENKIVTPRYGVPFKSMPMIAEEMQSVIGTIIAGGVPANIVLDASGKTQQDLNTVLSRGKLIDTRLYGLIVNTLSDQTAAIHAAFAANPNSSNFYVPRGVIRANIVYPNAYMTLIGDSMLTTIILPFDMTKPAVSFNKKLYSGLVQLSINAPQEFTSVNLLDATDTRYTYLKEFDIKKTIEDGQTHSYQTILIDQRPLTTEWTGYNTFDTVRATYGAYNYLADVDKLNSVLSMKDCVFAEAGYFGIKTNIENGSILSCDIAGNGKLQPVGTYDETQYGGMYLSGADSVVLACWHETNAQRGPNYSPNNLYIRPDSKNIVHNFGRNERGSNNIRFFNQGQGQLINVSTADRATDDGLGRARPQQLIKNGNFKHFNVATGLFNGWLGSLNGTRTQETSDLPNGYTTGFKLVSNSAGISNYYQKIYDAADIAGSIIKDISKWVGREITISFWLKNAGSLTSSIRGGIATDTNIYFSTGNYFAVTEVGKWQKFICSMKIIGDEAKIGVGFRITGVGEAAIVTGFSLADDCRVLDSQAKPITEDGGDIYGSLNVLTALKVNSVDVLTNPVSQTTTQLSNKVAPINISGKFIGKQVFNSADSKMYFATGVADVSTWKSTDSATTITPV